MQIIDELEPVRRGPYCGAIGFVSNTGHIEFNIAIRTMIVCQDQVHIPVGAGIVADSDPAAEYEETLVKAVACSPRWGFMKPRRDIFIGDARCAFVRPSRRSYNPPAMNRIFKTVLIFRSSHSRCGFCHNQPWPSHATTQPVTYREADEIKSALTYLASDQLEGRGLETQGIYKAADYIETQFKKDRLAPLSSLGGYRETFPITITTKICARDGIESE